MGKDHCIGLAGGLPFRLPDDLRRFRALTVGKPVVMGRRTWDSLPRRPLPGRLNIVLSRMTSPLIGGIVVTSTEEALAAIKDKDMVSEAEVSEVMVIGGGEIYRLFMPLASRILITVVDANVPGGDTFFPVFMNTGEWKLLESIPGASTENGEHVSYQEWVRRTS